MNKIRDVSVAILAGGVGSRLRPVVMDRPKVLAEVAGRPFLTYLLDQLVSAGVEEVVLLTGYRAEQIDDTLGDNYRGMTLIHSCEEDELGTGGALRAGLDFLSASTVLLLNGDSFCDLELPPFARFHVCHHAEISLALTQVADTSRYGRVRQGTRAQVIEFEEKQKGHGAGWINAGVYLISREVIEAIPSDKAVSLERDMLPRWVARGKVFGYQQDGPFIDIGTPESYALAEAFFAERWAFAH